MGPPEKGSMLNVTVPDGVGPGEQFVALSPEGNPISVTVPPGAFPGQLIQVQPPGLLMTGQPVAHSPVWSNTTSTQPRTVIVQDEVRAVDVSSMQAPGVDAVSEGQIILWQACCCSNCGLYLTPDCCGCSQKLGLLCLTCEACCKPNTVPLCCCCCELSCGKEFVLIKHQLQCCCFAESTAIPCDDEVPCAIAACGIACFPKCGYCYTLEKLTGVKQKVYRRRLMEVVGAPAIFEMER